MLLVVFTCVFADEGYDLLSSQLQIFFERVSCYKPPSSRLASAGLHSCIVALLCVHVVTCAHVFVCVVCRAFCCVSALPSSCELHACVVHGYRRRLKSTRSAVLRVCVLTLVCVCAAAALQSGSNQLIMPYLACGDLVGYDQLMLRARAQAKQSPADTSTTTKTTAAPPDKSAALLAKFVHLRDDRSTTGLNFLTPMTGTAQERE